ncbi:TonB-dependent receptor [Terasakiispira papahanaumokuakeensis]|uniref:Ferric aerobactin receptor n=1 Tax=Terasakiispira papahanaumokuakeensis TaxID=197479 RepID=A0A1E2VC97_9GAMM|nr:TonB-dependent receptor [Terasakiispira papahanaumokuakeensis]ODC04446.1 TonB-dependent receptor [Terasakiispira papahanaumokuakeensis]
MSFQTTVRYTPLALATLTLSAAPQLYAAQPQAEKLDKLVVTATRTPETISQIPGSVWVIEGETLRTQLDAGADLKTALGKLVPGLDLAPQSRTNYGQNLRGRSVQVLIDGVSMNSSRGLSRQFDSIDPFNIARVEVLSGASSLYGGGATGGIINIITQAPEEGPARFRSQGGVTTGFNNSNDLSYRLAQSVTGGTRTVQGRLSLAYQEEGRHYDANGDEIFPDIAQTDMQDNRSLDVMGNLRIQLSADQTLALMLQRYDSKYEGDRGVYFPHLNDENPDLSDAEIRDGFSADREPATERTLINAQYHHANLLDQDFYLQAYYRKEEAKFQAFPYPSNGSYQFRASKQNTKLSGIKGLFKASLTDTISLTYGLDFDHEEFDATQMSFDTAVSSATGGLKLRESSLVDRYPSYDIDNLAAFAQADWQFTEQLKLSGGIRQRETDVDVDDFKNVPGGSNDYDATLVNASLLYDFNNGQQTWLRYSQGFELPDPAKYYGKSAEVSVSQNPLSAIKTDQVELGWRLMDARWDMQAAIYYAWSDKAVENAEDLTVEVVDEDKRDYGLEAAVTRYFDQGLESGATLHLVRSEQKDADNDWQKRDARYASLSSATAYVGWHDEDRSARLQANHAFDLDDDSDHEIDGYTTFDLTLAQTIGPGRASLGVQNLLDKDYSTVWGQRASMFYSPYYGPAYLYDYKGRGRTYTLSYTLEY